RALISAARELYAAEGFDVPLSAIARRAGVGQGSLYRHFPERVDLAVAVFDENIGELERAVAAPERTLSDLIDAIVAQAMTSTALIRLLGDHRDDPRVRTIGTRFDALAARLLEREKAAGHVGDHIDVVDVALATGMLATEIARTAPAERDEVAARIRALFRIAFAPR
ncbi:helix-turn-helix domain-containing protein, partial [Microbacterium marinilacus]